MARTSSGSTLDEIISNAIAPVVERASAAIAKALAEMAEERVSRELAARPRKRGPGRRGRRSAAVRPKRNVEMTEWTADRRARRVPTFVIEATRLDTKKKIVAKFGEGVTFRRGKPLPAPRNESAGRSVAQTTASAARKVMAKPPRVRKVAAG